MCESSGCMICGHSVLFFVHKLRDDNSREVVKCKKCGHVQVTPLPSKEEDEIFYQNKQIYHHPFKNPEKNTNISITSNRFKAWCLYQPRKLIPHLNANWKILEIGSASGWLVEYLQDRGYDIDGVEISEDYRDAYRKRTGKTLLSFNFLNNEPDVLEKNGGGYDCLCIFHTLEHISDPVIFISRAAKLLKPGGMIYIDVPNNNDYMIPLCKEYEQFHYSRAHLSYFTPETLITLLEMCSFEEIKVLGNQIYSPENASQWLRYKEPFLDYHQIDLPEPIQWINTIYKDKVEADLTSCAIIGIGQKKN